MSKTAIVMIPHYSSETLISHSVGLEVAKYFRQKQLRCICLTGIFTTRPIVTRLMQRIRDNEEPPHLLMYFGHGERDNLIGTEIPNLQFKSLRPITEDNIDIVKDCIVYTVACNSRISLGEKSILNGALCYYGTTIPLDVLTKDDNKIFIDIFSEVPKKLTEGYTTYDACSAMDDKVRYYLEKVEKDNNDETILIKILGNYDIIGENIKWI